MQKKLLTSGSAFRRTDGRWCGVVWYMDEEGNRKRKSFSGNTRAIVKAKMRNYITQFEEETIDSQEANKRVQESMENWLKVFKFPSVEARTYDKLECIAKHQVYPAIGNMVVSNVTASDAKKVLTDYMNKGYSFSTVKQVYNLMNEFFRYLYQEEILHKNPMQRVEMIKKSNFFSAQGKDLEEAEKITVFTKDEIEKIKAEAFREYSNGKRIYQQSAAYIFMLNTGLRCGEMLGIINSDIDMENRMVHIRRGVKEVYKRDGTESKPGREIKVGKLKTRSSNRDVPLNNTAIEMIKELQNEFYFGEDAPLVPDENGDFTKPVNFRKRFYRILDSAGVEKRGLHTLRHTFATNLVNGIPQPDGTLKSLSPKQVADILGHTTSQITEAYYVRKDTARLSGVTDDFNM